jgi:hypothetical protein
MTQHIRGAEWRAYNESSNYPFSDSATLTNGADFIGEGILLDAVLHPVGAAARMHLSQVLVRNDSVTLRIGDPTNSNLAEVEFDVLDPPDELQLLDQHGRPAGLIVSEAARLATFQSWSLGLHTFTAAQTEFAARCCLPTPEVGLRGFLLDDGSVMTGDVWIVGEDGVVVTSREEQQRQIIRVDIVGDPLFRRRLCNDVFQTPRLLRTLTFRHGCAKIPVSPDEYGNITVTVTSKDQADTILRVRTNAHDLTLETVGERIERI